MVHAEELMVDHAFDDIEETPPDQESAGKKFVGPVEVTAMRSPPEDK